MFLLFLPLPLCFDFDFESDYLRFEVDGPMNAGGAAVFYKAALALDCWSSATTLLLALTLKTDARGLLVLLSRPSTFL